MSAGEPFSDSSSGRALGDDHLAAVGRGGDPRGSVHVDADVVAVGDQRLAGVDAHAHPQRQPPGQRLRVERACELLAAASASRGVGECDEEAVALRVDLDTAVPRERARSRRRWSAQDLRVAVAERVQEPGRPFDVREEERDPARRKIWHAAWE